MAELVDAVDKHASELALAREKNKESTQKVISGNKPDELLGNLDEAISSQALGEGRFRDYLSYGGIA